MAKILGLDLGTNSIGWAVVEKDIISNVENGILEKEEKFKLTDKGVHIFQEGVKNDKGTESSKAAERTERRSARRLKFRRKLRKYNTLLALAKNKMCPLDKEDIKQWRKSGFKDYPLKAEFIKWLRTDDKTNYNPYNLRDKASREKITPHELGRALYHIAQRRGFLSNRLDQSDEGIIEQHKPALIEIIEEQNNVTALQIEIENFFKSFDILEKKSNELDAGEKELKKLYNSFIKTLSNTNNNLSAIKEELINRLNRKENLGTVKQEILDISQKIKDTNCKTLGQYFNKLYKLDRNKDENKIRNQYTAREDHYLVEFEVICQTQEIEGINYNEKEPDKRYTGIVQELYKAIFYQRPLKSQKGLVGKCSLETNKHRCPVSHPTFEEYRMWCFINNIKIKTPQDEKLRFLYENEIIKIIPRFLRKTKPHFDFSDIKNELGKENHYNYKDNVTVSGCPTSASLKSIFGQDWKQNIYNIYSNKNTQQGKKTQYDIINDVWHVLFNFDSNEKLKIFAKEKLQLDNPDATKFGKINLKKDYASLSLKAINNILPYLKEGLIYSHAVFMANAKNVVDKHIWNNEQNRKIIQEGINQIITNHIEENRRTGMVNDLLKRFKDEYISKDKNYTLDNVDKKWVIEKIHSVYGEQSYKDKPTEEQEEILQFVEDYFEKQIQTDEFLKIKRIDEKVKDFLTGKNKDGVIYCSEKKNLNKLYHPSDIETFKSKEYKDERSGKTYSILGSPMIPSIKNPMAMRTLHQLRKLTNALIKEEIIDSDTTVHIELARELNDANKRKAILRYQNERKDKRNEYKEKIRFLYLDQCGKEIEPTEDDIIRYQLWLEQNTKEIYEKGATKSIGICSIIGSDPEYDIEHTIPRSVSIDNSMMNKTLCSKRYNRDTKKNKIPFELENHQEIISRIEHWKSKYKELDGKIKQLIKATKAATTKEQKDRKIQERHYLTMHRDYWKGKYERFTMEEVKQGFKNSQLVDTGIITKYAREYLKSVFKKTHSVKGEMVDIFRKSWGLHDSYIDDAGQVHYKKKDRSNHIHHCTDAITIACMTKNKYDLLANAWRQEEAGIKQDARSIIENSKPWPTFSRDVRNVVNEVLITHHTPDNVPKQSKKKLRKRGKIQYTPEFIINDKGDKIIKKDSNGKIIYKKDKKGEKIPIFEKGDAARGSLHQETFYGAIKQPEKENGKIKFDETKKMILIKDNKGNDEIYYVVRKTLEDLKKSDIKNIVDNIVKEKVQNASDEGIIKFSSNDQQKNKILGKVWMNKQKHVEIKKVRIKYSKTPIEIKKHSALSKSNHLHKSKIYAQNDENYCMAIYEGTNKKEKIERTQELVNMIKSITYHKTSNKSSKNKYPIVPEAEAVHQYPLKYILTKGIMVLLYNSNPNEIWEMNQQEKLTRLYKITQLDVEASCIKLLYHQEAREKKEITKAMGLKNGMKGGKNIDKHKEFPWIKISQNNFDALVEGYDFRITPIGRIEKIKK